MDSNPTYAYMSRDKYAEVYHALYANNRIARSPAVSLTWHDLGLMFVEGRVDDRVKFKVIDTHKYMLARLKHGI